jgi:hypothetical protein
MKQDASRQPSTLMSSARALAIECRIDENARESTIRSVPGSFDLTGIQIW